MGTSNDDEHDPEVLAVLLFANYRQVVQWCLRGLPKGAPAVLTLDGERQVTCALCGATFLRGDSWGVRADIIDTHLRKVHLPTVLRQCRDEGKPLKLSP